MKVFKNFLLGLCVLIFSTQSFQVFATSNSVNLEYYMSNFFDPNYQTQEPETDHPLLKSILDRDLEMDDFGKIRFRAPLAQNNGPVVILFHAIYGGVSHRVWHKMLPLLDNHGYRVYLMDLPGTGASNKPKKKYTMEVIDDFIDKFSEIVYAEEGFQKIHAITTSTITNSLLLVGSKHPDRFKSLIALSPVGINSLSKGPNFFQKTFFKYEHKYKSNEVNTYINLLREKEIKYYLGQSWNDPRRLESQDNIFVLQAKYQQANWDQRWITYSFVAGNIFRSFSTATKNLDKTNVLLLFGENIKPFRPKGIIGKLFNFKAEKIDDFREVVKNKTNFELKEIKNGAASLAQEKPEETFFEVSQFINTLK